MELSFSHSEMNTRPPVTQRAWSICAFYGYGYQGFIVTVAGKILQEDTKYS
jgi:hypothetical protein